MLLRSSHEEIQSIVSHSLDAAKKFNPNIKRVSVPNVWGVSDSSVQCYDLSDLFRKKDLPCVRT